MSCARSAIEPRSATCSGLRRSIALAVGRADDDVRPDPHLLRDGARRPASGAARDGPPEVPDPPHRHRRHRHRRRRSRRPSSRSASSPIIRTRARFSPSRWSRSVSWSCARRTRAARRPFRTPAVCIVAPLAIVGCIALFVNLPMASRSWCCRLGRDRPADLFRYYGIAAAMSAAASSRCRSCGRCARIDRHRADAGRAGRRPSDRD